MAPRIEWTTARAAGVEWLDPGDEAPDGQVPEYGGGALVIGPLAIEGTPAELRVLLARAASVVPRS